VITVAAQDRGSRTGGRPPRPGLPHHTRTDHGPHRSNARPSPHLAPTAAPSTHGLAEEGYRLAVCLLDDEQAAATLLVRIVGALRPRRLRRPTPAVRAAVLRRLIAGARAARVGGAVPRSRPRRALFPELQALPVAEREVLALAVACDLDVGDAARVLRSDPTRVLALRRTAVRLVAAVARAAGGEATTARLHRPA
jgi:hypothetical protein